MLPIHLRRLIVVVLLATLCPAARAQVVISTEIKARKGLYPIALPQPVSSDRDMARLVSAVATFDLEVSSWFRVATPSDGPPYRGDLEAEGLGIDVDLWKQTGVLGVIKSRAVVSGGKVTMQFKLYELERGGSPSLERILTGEVASARRLVHQFCDDVVKHLSGEPGFFTSQITFVARRAGRRGSSIMTMDFDGAGGRSLTQNASINILPAHSPSGRQIAFTSYMRGNADLYLSAGSGRPKRISRRDGMNTGASFSPDGSKIAVTLSHDGNPEIYVLDAGDGAILRRLTDNRHIDTSPAWSPDGSEIAFVSNREGGPQIFVMSADGSNQRRISTVASFCQTPAWNPRKGTRQLAYTIRDDQSGRFDIITHDLVTGKLTRVTQDEGDNEEPTWSPNGRVLAFASSRKDGTGVFLANADGTGEKRLVWRGAATSPDWGPAR